MLTHQPLTRRQKVFLHRVATLGPATAFDPDHRPSPAILSRWLRSDAFNTALSEFLAAHRDFFAGRHAAATLLSQFASLDTPSHATTPALLDTLESLLRHRSARDISDSNRCLAALPPR